MVVINKGIEGRRCYLEDGGYVQVTGGAEKADRAEGS